MAASNSQRNWNRFFDKSNGKSAEAVDKRAGPKRIRRAKIGRASCRERV